MKNVLDDLNVHDVDPEETSGGLSRSTRSSIAMAWTVRTS